MTSIGNGAFEYCENLISVYCYAKNVPKTEKSVFDDAAFRKTTLYVPKSSIDAYKSTKPWSDFRKIKGIDDEEEKTCAMPTISFENGTLHFTTATPQAIITSNITSVDFGTYTGDEISLAATYTITAVAKRNEYQDSDVATATLHWLNGTINTDGIPHAFDAKRAILVSSRDGFVTVSGLNDGEVVEAYSAEGKMICSVRATGDVANVVAKSGEVIVLKIGDEKIKTVVR